MTTEFHYSLNSNWFKKFSHDEVVALAKEAGLEGMEWGLPSLEATEASAQSMAAATLKGGLELVSFINAGQLWKTDSMRKYSEALKAVGGKMLRVGPPWFAWDYQESLHMKNSFKELLKWTRDGLEKLVPLGKEYGIRYVIELHGGGVVSSPFIAKQLLEGLDPACVGVIYDPANGIMEGFLRPRAAVEVLGEYLAYVHVKNMYFRYGTKFLPGTVKRVAFERVICAPEFGMVDFVEVFSALKFHGWKGWISFEEFFKGATPAENLAEIKQSLQFLRDCEKEAIYQVSPPFITYND